MKLKELFSILPNLELLHIKEDFATEFGTGYRILKEMPSIISKNSYYE
jgi:hypothetical protein